MTNQESIIALEAVKPRVPNLHRRVLRAVRDLKTATVKDVVRKTGLERLTVGARLTELKQRGMLDVTDIVRDGCRALRLSANGVDALKAARA